MKKLCVLLCLIMTIPLVSFAHFHKGEHRHNPDGSITWLDQDNSDLRYIPMLSCSGRDAKGNMITGSLQQYFINGNPHSSHLWSLQNQNEKWIIYTEFGVIGPFKNMRITYTSLFSKDVRGKPVSENGSSNLYVGQSGNQFRINGTASLWSSNRTSTYDFDLSCWEIKK